MVMGKGVNHMVFNDNIEELYNVMLNFLKEYESLPDSAPFDLTIFNLLKTHFELFKDQASKISADCEALLLKASDDFDAVMKKYSADSISLNKSFYNIKKANEEEMNDKINKIRDDINAEKIDNQNHSISKEMEIEWSTLSNEQSSQLIKEEHKNAISRFDYQREHYRNVYNESVKNFNTELQSSLALENEKYETQKTEFEANSSAIINRYEESISAESDILAKYTSDFSAKQAEQRESSFKETVELNDRIRSLVTINNRKIIEEKTDYLKDQNINKLEKDLNHQAFLNDSQSVSRTFVSKMTILDEKIDEIRNEYNNNISAETKNLQYKLLKLHKDEEKEISEVLSSTTDKKLQKKLINKISNKYYKLSNIEKKKSRNDINILKLRFSIESENDTHNKKILDLNRSYDLRIVSEKEQRDNKYFQELNNMDENDYSFRTKTHKIDYNAAANLIRLESSLKELESKAEYEKINAGHQKEIQKLLIKVKKIRCELDSYKKFQSTIEELEKYRHDRTIQYLTVNTLLDIEKCKVLMEYNERKYKHNVNNAKNTLGAGDIKLKNQNNRLADITHAELKISEELSKAKIERLESEIKLIKQAHTDSIIRIERDNKYDSENLISDVLFSRFKIEIKSFENLITAYTLLIKEIEHLSTAIIDTVLDNIKLRPEHLLIVRSFFKQFMGNLAEYYEKFAKEFVEKGYKIIEDRIKFEKEFKYKSDYDSLMIEYNSNISIKQEEKNKQMDEISKVYNEIEGKRQSIFAIRNQIGYLKNPFGLSNEKNVKQKILALVKEKKTEEANLEKLLKKLVPLKNKLESINDEINQIQLDNEKRENQINDLQRDGSESYYDFKRSLNNLFENYNSLLIQMIFKDEDEANCQNYEAILQNRRNELIKFDNDTISKLYHFVNEFRKASTIAIDKADSILKNEYSKECLKLDSRAKNNISAINSIIDRDEAGSKEYIKVLESEKRAIIRRHDKIDREFNDFINDTSVEASRIARDIDETFYSEYYAIDSNQKDINNDYVNDIKMTNYKEDQARINYIKKLSDDKNLLDSELKRYIDARNEYIGEIPSRKRAERNNLNKEVKIKNKALYQEKILNKANYIKERSEHFSKIKLINTAMDARIRTIETERKKKIKKEKRAHILRLKKLTLLLKS